MDAVKLRAVIQEPGQAHPLAAGVDGQLLRGLEHDFDRTGQRFPPLPEQQRRAQHAGGMEIMAAGMHFPRLTGGIGQPGFLLDGQRVNIAAQADHAARAAAADLRDHARFQPGIQHGHARRRQRLFDLLRGSMLLQPQLGMPVEVLKKSAQFLFCHRGPVPFIHL